MLMMSTPLRYGVQGQEDGLRHRLPDYLLHKSIIHNKSAKQKRIKHL